MCWMMSIIIMGGLITPVWAQNSALQNSTLQDSPPPNSAPTEQIQRKSSFFSSWSLFSRSSSKPQETPSSEKGRSFVSPPDLIDVASPSLAAGTALEGGGEDKGIVGASVEIPGGKVQETAPFKSDLDAFSEGLNNYRAGDKPAALKALEFAANKGHPRALWKLGRMYADGDGVPRNDYKAYRQFERIADQYADAPRMSPDARFISSAFVMLGQYLLDGIPNTSVRANPKKACDLFNYAASYYGDPAAQFQLGRQYLTGMGVGKDPRQAARWFHLAAEKGYAPAQALLGQLFISGNGVPQQVAKGLMWLAMAKDSADSEREAWIIQMHDEAYANSPDTARQAALGFLELQKRRK
jgi:uncharacterized protein